jgi:hypothetical protein
MKIQLYKHRAIESVQSTAYFDTEYSFAFEKFQLLTDLVN